ncbi:MAG: cation:proton antiporter [Myxococcaceae bacterium]|uniref:Na(+)/H(+) antiporter subunit F n=1 Tax=Corallococcus coralloides TaxID=184914 RepID=A0A410RIW1_CORCK|nr:monovalent cation/H+ antiporter complex subunit F [Corallococcus coralloides]QAT81805.1 Na(+)/H(+) antiporter subunit F [Corallococcus coralloides]RYZ36003.1 MAG: cation:proton antiporter [Myxococcaceae bacterium]
MSAPDPPGFTLLLEVILGLLTLAMALVFLRLLRGPTAPDRVVALDTMGVLTLGMTAVYSVYTREPHLLRVAAGIALISFLGTVAVARYLERVKAG